MNFIEFKLPKEIEKLSNVEYFISYMLTDENGFKMAFYQKPDDIYEIVFDFGYAAVDYRVSKEGRRFDHHIGKFPSDWLLIEVKDSDYLRNVYEESRGIYSELNPNLKHYIAGDVDYLVDIISDDEPKVYKVEKSYKKCI
jgi:hypothetical protein